ncbi:MAG TPA: DNA-J related domain-containing protein [Spirochaetota bacterium]|nr:DNA-J related domain-containing protein [Spirochaetota bacterium]HPP49169.1 DNA-J related domain-containing protein [Spirochaetota bacterium]HXK64757.1 DNA-J related domain-containing protein [Spirochaetota bacterium]
MNKLIEIPKESLIAYCLNIPRPVMESVIIREIVNPLCNGHSTLYQKHFSLFHALYNIKNNPDYFNYMVHIHPMQIVIRNYPVNNKCIDYNPLTDSFCGNQTVDGTYCPFHYTFHAPFRGDMIYDPLNEFYSDPYNINYEFSDELKKVYSGFTKYIINRRKVEQALSFFSFSAMEHCNKALLQKRYRELVKKYHPDHYHGDTTMIKEINAHYTLLKEIFVV